MDSGTRFPPASPSELAACATQIVKDVRGEDGDFAGLLHFNSPYGYGSLMTAIECLAEAVTKLAEAQRGN